MMQIKLRIKIKCNAHPKYNPDKDGEAGIRGGCGICASMLEVSKMHQKLTRSALDVISAAAR